MTLWNSTFQLFSDNGFKTNVFLSDVLSLNNALLIKFNKEDYTLNLLKIKGSVSVILKIKESVSVILKIKRSVSVILKIKWSVSVILKIKGSVSVILKIKGSVSVILNIKRACKRNFKD